MIIQTKIQVSGKNNKILILLELVLAGAPNEELKKVAVRRRKKNFLAMQIYGPKFFIISSLSEIEP